MLEERRHMEKEGKDGPLHHTQHRREPLCGPYVGSACPSPEQGCLAAKAGGTQRTQDVERFRVPAGGVCKKAMEESNR